MIVTLTEVIALSRHGWALPVLAALTGGAKPRAGALAHALPGASREALVDAVGHLKALGYLTSSEGHGHPLRAEMHLSPSGQKLAEEARAVWDLSGSLDARRFVRLRWSLPLVRAMEAPTGFGGLRQCLAPVTDRALSIALKTATTEGFVARAVDSDRFPPATLYTPLDKSLRLCESMRS